VSATASLVEIPPFVYLPNISAKSVLLDFFGQPNDVEASLIEDEDRPAMIAVNRTRSLSIAAELVDRHVGH
jgi:hypothetical protein